MVWKKDVIKLQLLLKVITFLVIRLDYMFKNIHYVALHVFVHAALFWNLVSRFRKSDMYKLMLMIGSPV